VGPRAGLGGCGNLAPPGFDPRSLQPVASRYSDCAIPAHPWSLHRTEMGDVRLVSRPRHQLPCLRIFMDFLFSFRKIPEHHLD
jgi:hypothetical protein